MDSSDSDSDTLANVPRKKTKYSTKYNREWESDPLFRAWLTKSSKGSFFAYCSACDQHLSLSSGKGDLKKHVTVKKHLKNCSTLARQVKLTDLPSTSGKSKLNNSVKAGEIRLASFVCEHDLPIRVVEHLPNLIREVCPDSNIAKQIECGRTKLTAIVNNVTGKESMNQLAKQLQSNKFSLIVDESTDKGCVKHLCMVARVMDNDGVNDAFLGLIPLTDATSDTLYNNIVSFFTDHDIPYKTNMIGFAADGANVMMGVHHSLSALLKNDIPHLFVMKCICHSFALCASYACLQLPRGIEDLARDVYNYFNSSPKRIGELKEFQAFINVKPHKILHPCQTRWLSLHMVVARLLEQYEALKLYFTGAVLDDQLLACENILQKLNDPATRLYLQFLDFILPLFNNLNLKMQSESPQIHIMYHEVSTTLRTILDCYIKDEHLSKTALMNVQYKNPSNFKPLEEVYFGAQVPITIRKTQNISNQEVTNFKVRCLDFYIEGVQQLFKRFPFDDNVLQRLEALDPSVVRNKSISSVVELAMRFPNIIGEDELQELDREWRLLRNTDINTATTTPTKCWISVQEIKKGDGTPMFPKLSKLMLSLLCLPHSSACVERVFSAVNRIKTKTRNRLTSRTISGLLHTKRLTKTAMCYDFNVSKEFINLMNNEMYMYNSDDDTDN